MEVVHERCAGLDVHKNSVVACAYWSGPGGTGVSRIQTFGTMTKDLETLADWLAEQACFDVAMEATGVYWKPVYNILEARDGFRPVVVNAQHLKAVPGRKTDVKDAQWIAQLLRHGLVRPSFIPEREQRELRELTRYRTALVRERASEINRLQKTLEAGNIKLGSVLSNVAGASGTRVLQQLSSGETDVHELASLVDYRVHASRETIEQALTGRVDRVLSFVIKQQLQHLADLDARIAACDEEVAYQMRPFQDDVQRLDDLPGIGPRTAQIILAEIGSDMSRFPTHRHLAAWAGLCPGNRASGGKRKPAKTRKGSPWLRAVMTEAATSAARNKDSYFSAQYHRLAARRGKQKAVIAVGHSILITVYHLLSNRTTYKDLGNVYFDQRDREALRKHSLRQLAKLGYAVHLTPLGAAV